MAYFHLRLHAPRPSFPFDASAAEKAAMANHVAYWQEQADAGVAIAVGPVFDMAGPWGMAVVEVAHEEDAQALAANDPITLSGLGFSYSIATIPSLILRKTSASL